jgi:hypothetical protein
MDEKIVEGEAAMDLYLKPAASVSGRIQRV